MPRQPLNRKSAVDVEIIRVAEDIPAACYPDPDDGGISERWWDGNSWTETTRPAVAEGPRGVATSVATTSRRVQTARPFPDHGERERKLRTQRNALAALSAILAVIAAIGMALGIAGSGKQSSTSSTAPGGGEQRAPQAQSAEALNARVRSIDAKLGCPIALVQSGGGYADGSQTADCVLPPLPADKAASHVNTEFSVNVFPTDEARDAYIQQVLNLGNVPIVRGEPGVVVTLQVNEDPSVIQYVVKATGGSVV